MSWTAFVSQMCTVSNITLRNSEERFYIKRKTFLVLSRDVCVRKYKQPNGLSASPSFPILRKSLFPSHFKRRLSETV